MTSVPEICTASWRTKLPANIVRIGVSRGVPRSASGYRRYRQLEPGSWFRTSSATEYVARYRAEILSRLDPHRVVSDLAALSNGHPVALLCWEEAGDEWCHRAIIAHWIGQHTAVDVREFGYEGVGLYHPLLPLGFGDMIAR